MKLLRESYMTAVKSAMEMGLKLDEKMKVGGWELLFRKARDGGSDFLIHAQPLRE
jgi:hypothetical protein